MTDGEPETVVSVGLQKIKSIKNPIKYFLIFYLIKSETSDSFVNHFDGHFAYLKTLDFYIKVVKLGVEHYDYNTSCGNNNVQHNDSDHACLPSRVLKM